MQNEKNTTLKPPESKAVRADFLNKLYPWVFWACLYGVLLWFFKPSLLFSKATPTGGDMGSHYYTAWFTAKELWREKVLFGWDFGWFAGYPPFNFYFPLAFVVMALLQLILPLAVSFKLVSLLGIFLLPPACHFAVKSFRFREPLPSAAAVLSLLFLFNVNMGSSAQIWGGTVLSVLAGEFSHSLSIALSLFFLGLLERSLEKRSRSLLLGVLLAAILLSHPLSFFWTCAVAAGLVLSRASVQSLLYGARIALTGFLLSCFWLVPVVLTRPYFLNLTYWWPVSFKDVLPTQLVFWPAAALPAIVFWQKKYLRFFLFIIISIVSSLVLAYLATRLGTYPMRFFPYLQLVWVIIGALFFLPLEGRKAGLAAVLLLLAGTAFYLIKFQPPTVKNWVAWNFSGLENKRSFRDFNRANLSIGGNSNDPRAVIEYTDQDDVGSSRDTELAPLLSGRQTLDGLYTFASITNPFIFKLQSELSENRSCQTDVIGLKCGTLDYRLGAAHMELFNVDRLILRSAKAKNAARQAEGFVKLDSFGQFEVWGYGLKEKGYVTVPAYEPVVYGGTDAWMNQSFSWFNSEHLDVPVIFNASAGELSGLKRISDIKDMAYGNTRPSGCQVSSRLEFNRISFKTSCAGFAHLVKTTYHPGWSVSGASKIYLASPSFMLVFPDREEVVLTYGSRPWLRLGWLSGTALAVLAAYGIYGLLSKRKKHAE